MSREPRLYRIKFDLADQILGNRYGYRRPAGASASARRVGPSGDEAATVRLYKEAACAWFPVVSGATAGRRQQSRRGYIRLALVADSETTAERCTGWSQF